MIKINFKKSLLPILGAVAFCGVTSGERLVILHTNDTHSTIDPLPDGTGGVLQRKAIIDSVRNAEKNVILVDAGDVVQGTTYFKYFKGDVEYPLMDMMGYDIRVLGNHEFDNGMQSLAKYYNGTKGVPLSANYDFTGTELEGIFKPYLIKEFDGKKLGFIGINIDPASIIAHKNIAGEFREVIPVANELASKLKNEEGCDMVAVISHIGYITGNSKTSDIDLAEASTDIDLIIGGHSHTLIDPKTPEETPSLIKNKNGKPVRIVQTGKQGRYIGKLSIDLGQLPLAGGEQVEYELIPVTDRFPVELLDERMIDHIRPYREAVDSINNVVIGYSEYELEKSRTGGLPNLTADISFQYAKSVADSLQSMGINIPDVNMSIMNVGGIRHHMPVGEITEGQILSTYPFSNHMVIIGVKGSDIIEAMRISASKGGEAISSNVRVVTDNSGNLIRVVIDGKEMDPEREYIVSTIDYVAEGNDDLVSLANHRKIWEDDVEVSIPILLWIKNQQKLGLKIAPDQGRRFVEEAPSLPFVEN
ncbi:MAG: bifunctional metallophosphatase/5'-nucleotidase [Muribaculaceae bacterium]|nr:bifunctional metallophosphatase/5'-nucleotidase [Muribaculaceae bacterium]